MYILIMLLLGHVYTDIDLAVDSSAALSNLSQKDAEIMSANLPSETELAIILKKMSLDDSYKYMSQLGLNCTVVTDHQSLSNTGATSILACRKKIRSAWATDIISVTVLYDDKPKAYKVIFGKNTINL